MVTLKINGVQIIVEEGTNVIEAAQKAGVEIPHFCYHPGLSLSGTCRMCYVEIKGVPKLQIGCNTPVKEGMEVYTESPAVIKERKAVLEFLLLNHPLDCPICDKGGECPLQNYTMAHGPGQSRFEFDKLTRYKRRPLSEKIVFDPERCVLCLRCTRFTEEVTGTNELWVRNRSNRKEITLFSDRPLHNNFQGNLADICPVGALTSADFRFMARVWDLENTESICNLCSVGCSITTWNRKNEVMRLRNLAMPKGEAGSSTWNGKSQVVRISPRVNMEVNEWWMCDKGRYGYHFINSENRATQPLIRENGKMVPVSWEKALEKAAQGLSGVMHKRGPSALGGVCGPQCSNEDAYLFQKLMRCALHTDNIDSGVNPSSRGQLVSLRKNGCAMSSLATLDNADAILVYGEDLTEEHPIFSLRVRRAAARNGARLVIAHSGPTKLDDISGQKLNYREGAGKTLLMGIIKSMVREPPIPARYRQVATSIKNLSMEKVAHETGVPVGDISRAAEILGSGKNRAILFNYDSTDDSLLDTLDFLSTIMGGRQGVSILMLGQGGNARGMEDMGVAPSWLPGYVTVEGGGAEKLKEFYPSASPAGKGLSGRELIAGAADGQVGALYLVGVNPAEDDDAQEALKKLDFLVVQDLFLTETGMEADVFFPSVSFVEKLGSFTNALGRVQRFNRSFKPIGSCREDWKVFSQLAAALGADFCYRGQENIQEEINRLWEKLFGRPYIL